MLSSPGAAAASPGDPHRFRLRAGVVELDCALFGDLEPHHRRVLAWQLREFVVPPDAPLTGARIDCRLELAGPGPLALIGEPTDAPRATRVGRSVFVEWPYYRAVFSPDRADVLLSSAPVGLDHALRGAVVFGTLPDRALYFHGASLVYDGRAFLFVGPSGAGKSTIAREGGADHVICDEISIVEPTTPWTVHPSPFWGTLGYAHLRASAPLAAIAVLSHGTGNTTWRPVHGVARVARLLPHVGAQSRSQLADPALLARLTQLVADLPVFDVSWARSQHALHGSPWKPST